MSTARVTGLLPGLILTLVLAGASSPAAGRPETVAPRHLPAPKVLVQGGPWVDLAAQVLWSDPGFIHVLGLVPRQLVRVSPLTGLVDVIAIEGPGPFEVQGPLVLLSAGEVEGEVLAHQPSSLRSVVFSSTKPPRLIRHESPITGSARGWWLGPVHWDPSAGAPARVQVRADATAAAAWTGEHSGPMEEVLTAQYFTRLLRGPGKRLWRVVLGMRGSADLVDPARGTSQRLEVDPAEGAWIEASADRNGTLHLLTSGGGGSVGRRILRFDPEPLPVLVGDRDWNTGAVDPDGTRWVGIDAGDATVLVYGIDRSTRDPSNR